MPSTESSTPITFRTRNHARAQALMTHLQQQFGEEEVKFTIHAARNDNLLLQVGRRMSASQELIDEIRTEAVRFAIEQQGMPKTTVATDILHVTNRLATR